MQTEPKQNEQLTLAPIDTYPQVKSPELKKLEPGNKTIKLISKAETKRVPKEQIISFLKSKGLPQSKITESYSTYYTQNGLYEIRFNSRPLGFCVMKGNNGKNAIISSIEHTENLQKGMKIASYIYQINGKRIDNINYKQILNQISQQKTPFNIVFKCTETHEKHEKQNQCCRKSFSSSSISSSDYQWDCSPFLATNDNVLCISPSISPLIGSDVYMTPSDYEYDDYELDSFQLNRAFTFGERHIKKELKKDKLIKKDTNEILLIGCDNSGKTTIMKNLKQIYGNGYNEKEKIKFIPFIHTLIIQQMQILLNITDGRQNKYKLSNKALRAKQYLNNISFSQILDINICAAIKYLWNKKVIKDLYAEYQSSNEINQNVAYFWDEIDRINKRDYMPTPYDILRVPHKPTRIIEQKYKLKNKTFNVINIGGQRSNWKKWIECFSNVGIVIFVVSLECYDFELTNYSQLVMNYFIEKHYFDDICEDIRSVILKYCIELRVASKNAMVEQLLFWQKIINHTALKDTQIVLCLNKFDLFYKKIVNTPLSVCPALKYYYGSKYSVDANVEYIRDKFFSLEETRMRYIDCWFMDGMDYKSIQRYFNGRIRKLLQPQTLTVKVIK